MAKKPKSLVDRMASRAKELADKPIDKLRSMCPIQGESARERVKLCKNSNVSRGSIIEAILVEEFSDEDEPR